MHGGEDKGEEQEAFTGRARDRSTRSSVWVADVLSRLLITAGGIGTILAVTGVAVFLIAVVVPLFDSADVRAEEGGRVSSLAASERVPVATGLDEYGVMGWSLWNDGELEVYRLDTGAPCTSETLFGPDELLCASAPLLGDLYAFGLANGSVRLTRIGFRTEYLREDWVPAETRAELAERELGGVVDHERGILQLTPQGQYRHQVLEIVPVVEEPVAAGPVRLIDHVDGREGPLVLALAADDTGEGEELFSIQCEERESFLTGRTTFAFGAVVPVPLDGLRERPEFLVTAGTGKDYYLAWRDGEFVRIRCGSQLDDTFPAERGHLIPSGELAFVDFVLGQNTLLWGDDRGGVQAGFGVRRSEVEDIGRFASRALSDRTEFGLVAAKRLRESGSPAVCMDVSRSRRVAIVGFADGTAEIYGVTSEDRLARFEVPGGEPVLRVAISPKEDRLLCVTSTSGHLFGLDLQHPEAAFGALFGRVWYEGYAETTHTWQSSSGHTGFEPKYGLIPLVFGTLKATFYSMLFGAPLAVLAALYSSEFLSKKTKATIKPTIELMASLPSVVLGFLAAQAFAPFVDGILPGALALLLCVPLAFVACAYLWQLLPQERALHLGRYRLVLFGPALAAGVALSLVVGPMLEGVLFEGDVRGWLNWAGEGETFSSPFGGWAMLFLPISALVVAFAQNRLLSGYLRSQSLSRERVEMARFDLLRFGVLGVSVVLLTCLLAGLVTVAGFDPRGTFEVWGLDLAPLGAYSQRNSVIVGFVMGFAIIPIIYTIADDALSSVPNHLRSASLGAGATVWQTAVRIVLPTAMSGIFSALMIGLGRAVGETMIVLMATGNTPILDLNGFSGFRTLAANIAVELPEAVRDSTHYRTLFLAALVLFLMTFAVNTVAESVRLRFRKRAYQL